MTLSPKFKLLTHSINRPSKPLERMQMRRTPSSWDGPPGSRSAPIIFRNRTPPTSRATTTITFGTISISPIAKTGASGCLPCTACRRPATLATLKLTVRRSKASSVCTLRAAAAPKARTAATSTECRRTKIAKAKTTMRRMCLGGPGMPRSETTGRASAASERSAAALNSRLK